MLTNRQCAILPPDFHQYGTVGVPVPSVEVKLVDVPEFVDAPRVLESGSDRSVTAPTTSRAAIHLKVKSGFVDRR